MVRILFVEHDVGAVGGSLRSLLSLVLNLEPGRFESFVTLTPGSPNPMAPALREAGCRVVPVGSRLPRTPDGGLRLRSAPRPRARWRRALRRLARDARGGIEGLRRLWGVARAIRHHRIDLVHANNHVRANWYALVAAGLCGVPVVSHQRFWFRVDARDRLLARRASAVLCNSHFVRERLARLCASERMHVIHNGVPIPERRPVHPPPGDAPMIALVGRLVPGKGPHVFLEAVSRMRARFPRARFRLVGGPMGPESQAYAESLPQLAASLGVADCVRFEGHVDDVERVIDASDVVVHAAVEAEPFGRVLVEAMAAGRPVVASDDGGCREIVEHGESGLLFPPGDAVALADAVVRVLEDEPLRERLVARGFERARDRFDERSCARAIQAVYASVLEASGARRSAPRSRAT